MSYETRNTKNEPKQYDIRSTISKDSARSLKLARDALDSEEKQLLDEIMSNANVWSVDKDQALRLRHSIFHVMTCFFLGLPFQSQSTVSNLIKFFMPDTSQTPDGFYGISEGFNLIEIAVSSAHLSRRDHKIYKYKDLLNKFKTKYTKEVSKLHVYAFPELPDLQEIMETLVNDPPREASLNYEELIPVSEFLTNFLTLLRELKLHDDDGIPTPRPGPHVLPFSELQEEFYKSERRAFRNIEIVKSLYEGSSDYSNKNVTDEDGMFLDGIVDHVSNNFDKMLSWTVPRGKRSDVLVSF